jgi:multidrug resistance efflux pump
VREAQAEQHRSELRYQSEIGGINTTVAAIQAELAQARYYLDNTLMVAPEDVNLQVRPGMVAGDIRLGAIASFVCDADRYLLASFFQENLKYVKPGQSAEVALDLYPGQIWKGKVEAIRLEERDPTPAATLP